MYSNLKCMKDNVYKHCTTLSFHHHDPMRYLCVPLLNTEWPNEFPYNFYLPLPFDDHNVSYVEIHMSPNQYLLPRFYMLLNVFPSLFPFFFFILFQYI